MELSFSLSTDFIIAQILGAFALLFGLLALGNKNDRFLRPLMALQSFTLAVHYFFLQGGIGTASAMSAVSGARNVSSIFTTLKILAPIFIFVYIAFGFYTYKAPIDLLTPIASCISTYAYFYLKGFHLRVALLIVSFLWLLNNIFLISIAPALMELALVLTSMVTIYRIIAADEEDYYNNMFK